MTQGERVNAIRKSLNMTLESFGEKVGVSRGAMSNIERNQRNLTDQMVKSLCREFNVNYDWLMEEEGEMFSDLPQTILDELCSQYDCDSIDRSLIEEYLKLDSDSRQVLKDYIRNVFEKSGGE